MWKLHEIRISTDKVLLDHSHIYVYPLAALVLQQKSPVVVSDLTECQAENIDFQALYRKNVQLPEWVVQPEFKYEIFIAGSSSLKSETTQGLEMQG